jgi:hypothetical protein
LKAWVEITNKENDSKATQVENASMEIVGKIGKK